MKRFTFSSIGSVIGTFLAATPVHAQQIGVPRPDNFQIENIGVLISNALEIALVIAGILVFVYLVWGGIQYITSGGDKQKTEEARDRIVAALVGLAIVAAAWAVMQLVSYFFGIDVLDPNMTIPRGY